MKELLAVAIGGGIGSAGRFLLSGIVLHHFPNMRFPLPTLVVNVLGCFAIGLLAGYIDRSHPGAGLLRLFLITGCLGGFTTFSAFGFETFFLLETGSLWLGVANVAISIVAGLGGVVAGFRLLGPAV